MILARVSFIISKEMCFLLMRNPNISLPITSLNLAINLLSFSSLFSKFDENLSWISRIAKASFASASFEFVTEKDLNCLIKFFNYSCRDVCYLVVVVVFTAFGRKISNIFYSISLSKNPVLKLRRWDIVLENSESSFWSWASDSFHLSP